MRAALIGAGRRPSGHAGPSAGRQGTARGFLQDDSRANFGVGDSCHVVGSERNMFTVWDDLAGNEVRRFPAKVSESCERLGPIGAPNSGDDVSLRGGPSPRAASPKKVGAVPPPLLEFGHGAGDSSPTLREGHREIFNIAELMPADGTPS